MYTDVTGHGARGIGADIGPAVTAIIIVMVTVIIIAVVVTVIKRLVNLAHSMCDMQACTYFLACILWARGSVPICRDGVFSVRRLPVRRAHFHYLSTPDFKMAAPINVLVGSAMKKSTSTKLTGHQTSTKSTITCI